MMRRLNNSFWLIRDKYKSHHCFFIKTLLQIQFVLSNNLICGNYFSVVLLLSLFAFKRSANNLVSRNRSCFCTSKTQRKCALIASVNNHLGETRASLPFCVRQLCPLCFIIVVGRFLSFTGMFVCDSNIHNT